MNRAVNAFSALLAVAKAMEESRRQTHMWTADMGDALDALDAAHPGWREWLPPENTG